MRKLIRLMPNSLIRSAGQRKSGKGENMKPNYCTQNDGDCNICSLVSYGMDCYNKPIDNPVCPACHVRMGKAGTALSGTHKVPRWRCNQCGKTTIVK